MKLQLKLLITILLVVGFLNANKNKFLGDEFWRTANIAQVNGMIEQGLDVRAKDIDNVTALMYASAFSKDPNIIKKLVEKGAKLDDKDVDNVTALMYAATFNQNPKIIETLIKLGANITSRDKWGLIALDYAKKHERLKGTKALKMLSGG